MKTINLLTTLSLIAVTTVFLQCPRKDYYQPSPQYSFKEPAAITPYHLNYNTGDTVWVHIHIPGKMLTDTISRQSIFYDSASFSAGITVQLLYNNPFVADGAKLADFVYTPYVSAYESVNQNYTGTSITFGCNQSTDYDLLVGIIFIQKGVFGLELSGSVQKCYSYNYTYTPLSFYFDVPDSHADFYQNLPFGDINQQPADGVISLLNYKSAVCVNVE